MTILVVADTHALLWYLYDDPRLSATALAFFETIEKTGDQIATSAAMWNVVSEDDPAAAVRQRVLQGPLTSGSASC